MLGSAAVSFIIRKVRLNRFWFVEHEDAAG